MHIKQKVAATITGAVIFVTLGLVVDADPAWADGCRPTRNYCGAVVNQTPHQILICWGWNSPTKSCNEGYCEQISGKKPPCKDWLPGGHRAGGNGDDVDGFLVPAGHCFVVQGLGSGDRTVGPGWFEIHNGETATIPQIRGC